MTPSAGSVVRSTWYGTDTLTPDPAYLATAIDAALVAGTIARKFFRSDLAIHKKGAIDLVTEADVAVEQAIRARIERRFPRHAFLGEESGGQSASGAPYRWIVDPIDGTTNFAHGLALFCTSIALEIDGRVDVGVIYDPMADELFTVERGQGARLNGRRLAVSTAADMINALLVTGFPPSTSPTEREEQLRIFAAFLSRARAVRRLGSAALDLCFVAAGRFDAFWEQNLYAWDVAAGGLLVEEAGGRVSDYGGVSYSPFTRQIVASNGALHPKVIEVITAVKGESSSPRSIEYRS